MLTQDQNLGSPGCVWIGLETDRLFDEFISKARVVLLCAEAGLRCAMRSLRECDGRGNTRDRTPAA